MINKFSIQERFFVFLAITCLGITCMNHYFHQKIDRQISSSIEGGNKIARKHHSESMAKTQAIIHWKAMYESQKTYGFMLEQQIDAVSDYWRKEYIKVSDELFDIKNTKK